MTLKLASGFIIEVMQKTHFKIGELATRTHTSVETLRFYESEGLVVPKMRTNAGYRLYDSKDLQRLHFVLHAKKVGFSLKEIKRLLGLKLHKDEHTCEEVKQYTGDKIAEIEAKIDDLQKMQKVLSKLHEACCGGQESALNCSILQALEDSKFN